MSPSPDREPLPDAPPSPDQVQRVRELLASGALVALPTETVYGIAARADRAAPLEALRELKGRPAELGLSWHVGTRGALEQFPRVSPMALRLVERYWPGPLTLVLPGVPTGLERIAREGWTGVRLPAHAGTAGLLAELDFPVVLSSANLHGGPPCADAQRVAEDLGQGLALVLDGGASRLGESSSVLRVGPGRFELLRPGLHTLEQLRAAAGLRIAFVCTGNTCRSPMAEGLARKLLSERLACAPERLADFGFHLRSMGVFAAVGAAASPHAVSALGERGVDLGAHSSHPATLEEVAAQDRVYCLTASHLDALRLLLPPAKAGHLTLLDPDGQDVVDPYGGTRYEYERCAARIEELLMRRLEEWA
jgi:L-threonylcarbamoyladenylate synthase